LSKIINPATIEFMSLTNSFNDIPKISDSISVATHIQLKNY